MNSKISAILPFLIASGVARGECLTSLDRNRTLVQPVPHLVESYQGRMAAGEFPLGFAFPSPGGDECSQAFPKPRLGIGKTGDGERLGFLLLAGEEYRSGHSGVFSTEGGVLASGRRGIATANIDARMFVETGGEPGRQSFDAEDFDEQREEISGSIDYRSYSRFRGDFTLDLSFGRLTVARDAAHWGPGLFGNNVLSQQAVPFYQYVFSTRIGPLAITSLYGDLQIGANHAFAAENLRGRNMFAHRYELSLGKNWLLGVSEQLILHNFSKPYLFTPIFPLFVAKGFLVEDNTNGNLAADLTWRTPWKGLLYGEFLLDDLESPSSLFLRDYSQNKWAVTAGTHFIRDVRWARTGMVLEFSHVEPWVYSHFQPRTAQSSNLTLPLGNPQGPDSRTLIGKVYGRFGERFYAAGTLGLHWKGTGPGSDQENPSPEDPLTPQAGLEWGSSPDIAFEPEAVYTGSHAAVSLGARIGDEASLRSAIRIYF